MKKLLIRIVIAAFALVLVLLIVVFFSLNSIVKKGVETVGPKLTQVEVRLGAAHLSPFSGQGRLTELFVGNPQGFKTPSAIKVGDVKVGVEPSSVLADTLVVQEINLQAPEITFDGTLTGNNLSKILSNIEAASGSDKAEKPAAKKGEKKFYVKDLLVKAGKINVSITTPLGGKSATLALPEIHVQNIGSREHGVTAAELAEEILKPILASATKAVAERLTDLGTGAQGTGKGAVEEATKGIKDLFKK